MLDARTGTWCSVSWRSCSLTGRPSEPLCLVFHGSLAGIHAASGAHAGQACQRDWFLRGQGSLLLSCSSNILDFVEKRLYKILRRAENLRPRTIINGPPQPTVRLLWSEPGLSTTVWNNESSRPSCFLSPFQSNIRSPHLTRFCSQVISFLNVYEQPCQRNPAPSSVGFSPG